MLSGLAETADSVPAETVIKPAYDVPDYVQEILGIAKKELGYTEDRYKNTKYGICLPHIDAVLISHDHYDHLDRRTVQQLDRKTDRFIVSIGLEKHLEKWHISSEKITSLAWWESIDLNGLEITCTPSRHFFGAWYRRTKFNTMVFMGIA